MDNPKQSAPESQAGILTMPGVADTPSWESPAPDVADALPSPDVAEGDIAVPERRTGLPLARRSQKGYKTIFKNLLTSFKARCIIRIRRAALLKGGHL